jgi:hypothetical protein
MKLKLKKHNEAFAAEIARYREVGLHLTRCRISGM